MSSNTDTRIFKIIGLPNRRGNKYGDRATLSAVMGGRGWSLKNGRMKVYATNAEATDGWTDVTDEFTSRYGG